MVSDRLLLGCRDKGNKACLLREKYYSFKKALKALKISEATQEQLKDMGGEDNPIPINAVNQHKKGAKYSCRTSWSSQTQSNRTVVFVPLFFNHQLGSTTIDCQLDTGANCNVISKTDMCKILHTTNPSLQPEISQLRFYDNSVINTLGQYTLLCSYQSNT